MTTITIPAREIRKGDTIDIGGQPHGVILGCDFAISPGVFTVYLGDAEGVQMGSLNLMASASFVVDRPDSDAGLIEAMAQKYNDSDVYTGTAWDFLEDSRRAAIRHAMRAALAAARKAGAL